MTVSERLFEIAAERTDVQREKARWGDHIFIELGFYWINPGIVRLGHCYCYDIRIM